MSLRRVAPAAVLCASGCGILSCEAAVPQAYEGVGGHGGLLSHPGTILKPVTKCRREASFYAQVAAKCASDATAASSLWCAYIPKYGGIVTAPCPSGQCEYIALEDLTAGMARPCVLDVKVGVQSWDEDAAPVKAAREAAKWPLQARLGFRFTGMSVWKRAAEGAWRQEARGTEFGYGLTPDGFVDALAEYLGGGAPTPAAVSACVLERLGTILAAARRQHEWRVYGASILVAYDAAPAPDAVAPIIRVALIDFGHVWPIRTPGGVDEGMIHGLDTLMLFIAAAMVQAGAVGPSP